MKPKKKKNFQKIIVQTLLLLIISTITVARLNHPIEQRSVQPSWPLKDAVSE